jgi:hypothetical protein
MARERKDFESGNKVEAITSMINKAVNLLTPFLTNPVTRPHVENLISHFADIKTKIDALANDQLEKEVTVKKIQESENSVDQLTKKIDGLFQQQELMNITADTKLFSSALHEVELILAKAFVRNTQDPISLVEREDIEENDIIYTSTRHFYDINFLFRWIQEATKFTDPMTGAQFRDRDINTIQSILELRNMRIDSNQPHHDPEASIELDEIDQFATDLARGEKRMADERRAIINQLPSSAGSALPQNRQPPAIPISEEKYIEPTRRREGEALRVSTLPPELRDSKEARGGVGPALFQNRQHSSEQKYSVVTSRSAQSHNQAISGFEQRYSEASRRRRKELRITVLTLPPELRNLSEADTREQKPFQLPNSQDLPAWARNLDPHIQNFADKQDDLTPSKGPKRL